MSDAMRDAAADKLRQRIAELVPVLENVKLDPVKHPEGDRLEHTLQVFDRVHDERPFDEELLTVALVHDVGLPQLAPTAAMDVNWEEAGRRAPSGRPHAPTASDT